MNPARKPGPQGPGFRVVVAAGNVQFLHAGRKKFPNLLHYSSCSDGRRFASARPLAPVHSGKQ
jgi:hypothetical protein